MNALAIDHTLVAISIGCGFGSALCWLYSCRSISPKEGIRRRNAWNRKNGLPESQAAVVFRSKNEKKDLIETAEHSSKWSSYGAMLAAAAMLAQAAKEYRLAEWIGL